jgi:hypothetical protein
VSKRDPWVRVVSRSHPEWGYDGYQYDATIRVSISPNAMLLNTLRVSLPARGLLMSVFCRYWGNQRPPLLRDMRAEHRLSARKFQALLEELADFGLAEIQGGAIVPSMAFNVDPDEIERPTLAHLRKAPSGWLDTRDAVFERDGYACVYCGSGRDLHCDHVHPVALGGGHEMENLVTACAPCNLSKGSKTVAEWRPDIAEAWKR